jgi:hypothetical protein
VFELFNKLFTFDRLMGIFPSRGLSLKKCSCFDAKKLNDNHLKLPPNHTYLTRPL